MSDWKSIKKFEFEHDVANRQIEYFAKEMARLKAMEVEYKRLLDLVSIVAETNPIDSSVQITITKADQVTGNDWREILELAYNKPPTKMSVASEGEMDEN